MNNQPSSSSTVDTQLRKTFSVRWTEYKLNSHLARPQYNNDKTRNIFVNTLWCFLCILFDFDVLLPFQLLLFCVLIFFSLHFVPPVDHDGTQFVLFLSRNVFFLHSLLVHLNLMISCKATWSLEYLRLSICLMLTFGGSLCRTKNKNDWEYYEKSSLFKLADCHYAEFECWALCVYGWIQFFC